MSGSLDPWSGLDDERFEDLYDVLEDIMTVFFRTALVEQGIEATDDDIDDEVGAATGYIAIVLAVLRAQVLSVSTGDADEQVYDVRLTVPSGDLLDVVRGVLNEIDMNEDD